MLLLGLPLVFAALVLSMGVIEYRPDHDDPVARVEAIRRARALAAVHQPEVQPRHRLSPPTDPQAGPEQDLILFDR